MSFRFFRRIRIAPGLTVNLSKSGGSLSFGPRGSKFTVGPRGRRGTIGLPGTGLFYTTRYSDSSRKSRSSGEKNEPGVPVGDRLSLGFFKRLFTPDEEKAFVDGLRELASGNENKAYNHLKESVHLADGAFLAGFLAFKKKQFERAVTFLKIAESKKSRLGHYFSKYGISATLSIPITPEVSAHVEPDIRGIFLILVEVYQSQKKLDKAVETLQRFRKLDPEDIVVKLSLAELLLEAGSKVKDSSKKVIRLTEGIENQSALHAALLLYKARALRSMKMFDTSKQILSMALRRKKDRPADLLLSLRYERALVYEDLGQARRARSEFEKLYAEAPGYEDVAKRLG